MGGRPVASVPLIGMAQLCYLRKTHQGMELHQKIASARKRKGLTQEELAELANVTVRTIQRLESGETVPRPYTIKAIAAALDTTFETLTEDAPVEGAPENPHGQTVENERHFLETICLSCFSYLVIPFVHFLIPAWLLKKTNQRNPAVIALGRSLIKQQVYWVVALNLLMLLTLGLNFIIAIYFPEVPLVNYLWPFIFMYVLNAVLIIITLRRVKMWRHKSL